MKSRLFYIMLAIVIAAMLLMARYGGKSCVT
jgi:hypothetical protein